MKVEPRLLAHPVDRAAEPWWSRSVFDPLLLRLLKDRRDLLGARLILRMAIGMPIAAGLMYVDRFRSGWTIAAYLLLFLRFVDAFILAMHVQLHRPWFHNKTLNKVVPNFVGFFFGQTVWSYWAHHLAMHHPEDNEHEDLSSTLPFNRDSGAHLGLYLGTFMFVGMPLLITYFVRRKRYDIARRIVGGALLSWAIIGALAYLDWQATLVVFVVPIAAARFLMMLGNWGQHAFIKPGGDDAHTLGTTLLNTHHNRRCFNNGYHALHHARQAMHWAELPDYYGARLDEYLRNGAMVFDGVPSFQAVTLALVMGRYGWLEARLLRAPGDTRSSVERIEMLRALTRAIPAPVEVAEASP